MPMMGTDKEAAEFERRERSSRLFAGLKKWQTGSFLLTSNWSKEFVRRRNLQCFNFEISSDLPINEKIEWRIELQAVLSFNGPPDKHNLDHYLYALASPTRSQPPSSYPSLSGFELEGHG
nr:putative B3 domain-containing protein At1g78640 [Ipomoea batatas]